MTRNAIIQFISFFIYLLLQVMLFKSLPFFSVAFCFIYVGYILLLPIETNPLILMLVAFVMGFCVDMFYDSLGLHALTLVAIAYIRNYWLGVITPQGGYDAGALPNMPSQGLQWYLVYTLPLVFLHHLILFLVEASNMALFWHSMLKTIASLFFTMTFLVLQQYWLPQRERI